MELTDALVESLLVYVLFLKRSVSSWALPREKSRSPAFF